ncbi:MAG: RIP metalloprotease RseP [Candidatus Caldatribacteriota bacterium]|nr:RIP metalloprotease RseP [Candidatus Caldatribacteriota bacterium]
MITLIAFIFVFSILVFFHELGHFLSAKAFGVKVYKFSFGFGPKLFGFTKNETEYNICLIPLGGYVKMAGELGQEDKDATLEKVPDKQRFDKKPISIRAIIIALGPLMNIITSIVIISIILLLNGIPMTTSVVETVIENGPAYKAGILAGDKITEINFEKIDDSKDIVDIISNNTGKELIITVDRGDKKYDLTIIPEYNKEYKRGMIGISLNVIAKKLNPLSAIGEGIKTTGNIIKLIFTNIVGMLTGKVEVEVAGPLGIAQMTGEFAKLGFLNLLYFTAILSIFIGIFNLLPIPILDGGQIIILCIEKIRNKPLEPEKMNVIYFIGILLIIMVFLFATYKDITRIFLD